MGEVTGVGVVVGATVGVGVGVFVGAGVGVGVGVFVGDAVGPGVGVGVSVGEEVGGIAVAEGTIVADGVAGGSWAPYSCVLAPSTCCWL